MNELKVNGTQEFMGININTIEGGFGKDERLVLAKDIAKIHNVELKYVNKLINNNIERFNQNDIINLLSSSEELRKFAEINCLIGSNRTKDVFILSERGYTKLVSMMDNSNDKKWEVMDKFIDSYFTMRQQINTMLSAEDEYALKIFHAQSKEEVLTIMQNYQSTIVKPLRESIDKYERFLCEKTGMLTKSELAIKLDCKPQTLASKLKQANIYTPTSQVSVGFLKRYPNEKLVIECDNVYKDKTGEEHVKHGFQWTFIGAKIVVDYLVELGMVTFTENNGFKLK